MMISDRVGPDEKRIIRYILLGKAQLDKTFKKNYINCLADGLSIMFDFIDLVTTGRAKVCLVECRSIEEHSEVDDYYGSVVNAIRRQCAEDPYIANYLNMFVRLLTKTVELDDFENDLECYIEKALEYIMNSDDYYDSIVQLYSKIDDDKDMDAEEGDTHLTTEDPPLEGDSPKASEATTGLVDYSFELVSKYINRSSVFRAKAQEDDQDVVFSNGCLADGVSIMVDYVDLITKGTSKHCHVECRGVDARTERKEYFSDIARICIKESTQDKVLGNLLGSFIDLLRSNSSDLDLENDNSGDGHLANQLQAALDFILNSFEYLDSVTLLFSAQQSPTELMDGQSGPPSFRSEGIPTVVVSARSPRILFKNDPETIVPKSPKRQSLFTDNNAGAATGSIGGATGSKAAESDASRVKDFPPRFDIQRLPINPACRGNIPFSDLKHLTLKGHFGYSSVYSARLFHGDTQTEVVVKTLTDKSECPSEGNDPEALTGQLLREVALLERMSHPNVIKCYGSGGLPRLSQRVPFVLLERLQEHSLAEMLQQYVSSPPRPAFMSYAAVLQAGRSLASAMEYLHQGLHADVLVIYCNLCTESVGFAGNGVLKLTEFGSAVCVPRTPLNTSYSFPSGCRYQRYAAPEVLLSQSYSPASDVYGFGVVLWQIATGRTPFQEIKSEGFRETVAVNKYRPPLSAVPKGLSELIARCWSHDPSIRPTAASLLSEMTTLLGSLNETSSSLKPCISNQPSQPKSIISSISSFGKAVVRKLST